MFDEPSLGLAPLVVQEVLHIIRTLNEKGMTILLVEQNVAVSLKISNHAYVLENGSIVMSGKGADLLHDDRVRQAIWGFDSRGAEQRSQSDVFAERCAVQECAWRDGRRRPQVLNPIRLTEILRA
jgi:ABC-type multidrug transport system ATPase subunit